MPKNLFRDRDPATGNTGPTEDLLRAVPHLMDGVSVHCHDDGTAQVRLRTETRTWLARLMRTRTTVTRDRFFNLDRAGTAFCRSIDGSNTLGSMAEGIARSEEISVPEAQRGVIEYTRILLMRGLIGIESGQKRSPDDPIRNHR